MNREVVDALLGLFDQRVAKDFPGQVFGFAADFFQRLIDRHGADRHRRVANDPFARGVNVLAGRKIHHRVRAALDRPAHLLDFFVDRRQHGGVADVGVDLHQEVAADDHRLGFRMIDVRGNDGAAARDFVADEFGRDVFGIAAPNDSPGMLISDQIAGLAVGEAIDVCARCRFSRMAMNSISGVMMPARVVHLRDVRARPLRGAGGASD